MKRSGFSLPVLLFFIVPFSFLGGYIFLPEKTISVEERRELAQFPQISFEGVLDGKVQSGLDNYLNDQIPFRSGLLKLSSWFQTEVLRERDDHGLVLQDGSLIQLMPNLNEKSIEYAVNLFTRIYEQDLKDTDCSIYVSIIPDKAYFLNDPLYLTLDYEAFFSLVEEKLDFAQFIHIENQLDLSDYYFSDPHWRMEKLQKVLNTLSENLGIQPVEEYTSRQLADSFTGSYGAQSSYPYQKDSFTVLSNAIIEDLQLFDYSSGMPVEKEIYQTADLDLYETFLGGNKGLMELVNPNLSNGRELILFRDSFASPLAILLAQSYERVWVVDLRNINSQIVKNYISFQDQDVLFLYSTTVLNNAFSLR